MKFTIAWSSALKQALSPFENHDSFSCSAHFLLSFVKHLTEFVARESNTFGDLRSGKTFDRPRGTPEEERKLKGDQGSVVSQSCMPCSFMGLGWWRWKEAPCHGGIG